MRILAIETSCDETAAAVVEKKKSEKLVGVLSDVVASSQEMHKATGGIVPEVAAREQLKSIMAVIKQALLNISNCKSQETNKLQISNINESKTALKKIINSIDAIAVTVGPGLIGSLLVGVETTKALALAWGKPIVPVNHLKGHFYANWLAKNSNFQNPISKQISNHKSQKQEIPEFPIVGLLVSGGHTDLVLLRSHDEMDWLGGTRDDAAGECFDKAAKILGLHYPGGPAIAGAALKYSKNKLQFPNKFQIKLPRPLVNDESFDFSFSGLKTALRRAAMAQGKLTNSWKQMAAYEVQESITDVLVEKLRRAVEKLKPKSVLLGGGVAANLRLRHKLEFTISKLQFPINLYIPKSRWCTDNATYVGAYGLFHPDFVPIEKVKADPSLEIA